jgi:hypothetical protein
MSDVRLNSRQMDNIKEKLLVMFFAVLFFVSRVTWKSKHRVGLQCYNLNPSPIAPRQLSKWVNTRIIGRGAFDHFSCSTPSCRVKLSNMMSSRIKRKRSLHRIPLHCLLRTAAKFVWTRQAWDSLEFQKQIKLWTTFKGLVRHRTPNLIKFLKTGCF